MLLGHKPAIEGLVDRKPKLFFRNARGLGHVEERPERGGHPVARPFLGVGRSEVPPVQNDLPAGLAGKAPGHGEVVPIGEEVGKPVEGQGGLVREGHQPPVRRGPKGNAHEILVLGERSKGEAVDASRKPLPQSGAHTVACPLAVNPVAPGLIEGEHAALGQGHPVKLTFLLVPAHKPILRRPGHSAVVKSNTFG